MKGNFKLTILFIIALSSGSIANAKYSTTVIKDHEPTRQVYTGIASWYSKHSPGINKRTANNEIFNDKDLTAAMWSVPFNQKIKVTNPENGKSIIVRINDRGPHQRYVREGRIIDLTEAAFQQISSLKKGLIKIELEFL